MSIAKYVKPMVWLGGLLIAPLGHGASTLQPGALGACGFIRQIMQFRGPVQDQAACLLRTVQPWGRMPLQPAVLPDSLRWLMDSPTAIWKAPLRQWLVSHGVSERDLGGSLDAPLSSAQGQDGKVVSARYFVIHDTSWPWLNGGAFPPETDEHVNDLAIYAHATTAQAHVFVNRLGQTFTAHGFDEAWRATKLELRAIGAPAKGLFLHIELVQPRRRDPSGPAGNDALAPSPGFTVAQYDALALLYMVASVRAGTGLIPGLHGALDEGMADGHDDPQHFELDAFGAALARLEAQLSAREER